MVHMRLKNGKYEIFDRDLIRNTTSAVNYIVISYGYCVRLAWRCKHFISLEDERKAAIQYPMGKNRSIETLSITVQNDLYIPVTQNCRA